MSASSIQDCETFEKTRNGTVLVSNQFLESEALTPMFFRVPTKRKPAALVQEAERPSFNHAAGCSIIVLPKLPAEHFLLPFYAQKTPTPLSIHATLCAHVQPPDLDALSRATRRI